MQKLIKAALFTAAVLSIFVPIKPAQAFVTPLSIGVLPPVQFPPSDFTIAGVRVSALYGKHRDLYGIDLGLLGNITENTFVGTAVSGLVNETKGMTTVVGTQLAGLANVNLNKTRVIGVQLAGLFNANTAETSIVGLQAAIFANISEFSDLYGVQLGLYNRAKDVYGFQVGLVNKASSLHGIQIGLLNINQTGLIAMAPIINIGF